MASDDIKITIDSNFETGQAFTYAIDGASQEEVCSIHRVPHRLCEVNPKAYEPNFISIGPYHYGKEHLKAMEVMKRTCFAEIVAEKGLEYSNFEDAMKILKDRVRKCYEGPIQSDLEENTKAFIDMMIYDGCSVVRVIRCRPPEYLRKLGRYIEAWLLYDMLLLENQLPFFLLDKLDYMITEQSTRAQTDFSTAALSFFQKSDIPTLMWSERRADTSSTLHLLDLVHKCCLPSPQGIEEHNKYLKAIEGKGISQRSWKFIRSATELQDAGIHFSGKNVLQGQHQCLFDIKFTKRPFSFKIHKKEIKIPMLLMHKKVLEIPTLPVDDGTECMLRNLLVYEQFTWGPTYILDYVALMDSLINKDKDVQLLCTNGVIDNWLGDDEPVAQMFNKLTETLCWSGDYYYAEIFDNVNKHCNGEWNKYKAKLRKDYFSSPWSMCAVLAAFVLLVATLLQTIYTCISYYHPK